MQCLEVSGAVRPIYGSLGVKRLINIYIVALTSILKVVDSINTSDLTASCVSVCSSDALRKWRNEISNSVARSNFVSNLMKTQHKLTKN